MDAAALFGSANLHYVNEDYEEALKHYICAVTLQDCVEYRTCRAAVYLKLGKFVEALQDADEALKLEAASHMALHWKGIALFYQGDFAGAKLAFENSLRHGPNAKAPRAVWIRKCDAELSGSTLPLAGMTATTSKAAPSSAYPATQAAPAPVAAAPAAVAEAPAALATAETEEANAPTTSGRKKTRREWYQNNSHVFVAIFAKGVSEADVKSEFNEKSFSISIPLPDSGDDVYSLDLELYDDIDPAACKVEVSKVKVEISLAKKVFGVQWKELEPLTEAQMEKASQPLYPTSNKQKKDWSQIDRDMESDLKAEKPAGDEALNKLFKEIYERADDETRRAMNKSFQTSGGTVLSTNWGEVASSDYEGKDRPTPPEGQQWMDTRKQDGGKDGKPPEK